MTILGLLDLPKGVIMGGVETRDLLAWGDPKWVCILRQKLIRRYFPQDKPSMAKVSFIGLAESLRKEGAERPWHSRSGLTCAGCGRDQTDSTRSPNLNSHAERWVRPAKEECLSKLKSPRNRQLSPIPAPRSRPVPASMAECRLGGLLKYYITAMPHE